MTNDALAKILNSKLEESKESAENIQVNDGSPEPGEFTRRIKKWENTLAFFNRP